MSRDYATPDLTQLSPLVVSLPPSPVYQSTSTPSSTPYCHHGNGPQPPPAIPPPHGHVTNIQSWSGNSLYAVPNSDATWSNDGNVTEFPRHVLKFVEKLGEGRFGEVSSVCGRIHHITHHHHHHHHHLLTDGGRRWPFFQCWSSVVTGRFGPFEDPSECDGANPMSLHHKQKLDQVIHNTVNDSPVSSVMDICGVELMSSCCHWVFLVYSQCNCTQSPKLPWLSER